MSMTGGISQLVHTGIPKYGADTKYPIKLYVYHKSAQDSVNNKSVVTVGMYLVVPSGYYIGAWDDFYGSYVGIPDNTFDGSIPNMDGTRWLAENKTFEVQHNADGTGVATIQWKWGVHSAWGQFEDESGSFDVTLPTIPRAATIGATDANIGAVSMIAVGQKSTTYTHSIQYQFGALSGYVTAYGGVSATEVKLSATSIPFNVPTDFYAQIPNAKSGVCILTCRTYSGNTQVGESQTAAFKVTAAEEVCAPTVSGTVTDANDATAALTGDRSKMVRYKSTALCTISATAKNGASIAQKSIAGTVISGDENTLTIPEIENSSVLFSAVDSRGYVTNTEKLITLIPYIKLTNNAVVNRTDPTSGNAVLTLRGDCFSGSFGAVENAVTAKYRVNGGSYIDAQLSVKGNAYSAEIALAGMDYNTTHSVEVVVSDKLSESKKTIPVKRGVPVFDWGENDFAFNVPVHFKAASYNVDTKRLTIS